MAIDYKSLCEKYFPHVEIVRDFTDSPYYISANMRETLSQQEITKLEKLGEEEFSEEREKHGLSFGGSDVPIILGKGFIPASQLAAQKRNPKLKSKPNAAQQAMFDTGHRAETAIRETFERVSGMRTTQWPIMMRNPKYPHFLMNIDGLVFSEGKIGIYEGKWSQNFRIINDHWKKARDLRKEGVDPSPTIAPEKYLYQVWAYMAGLNLDFAYICGGWGYADNEIGYIYVPRLPEEQEEMMMDACEKFIEDVASGVVISDLNFMNKVKLDDVYKHLHAKLPDSGKPVVFPASDMESAKRYLELQERIKEEEERIDAILAAKKDELMFASGLAEMKEERDAIKTAFEEVMCGDTLGTISDGKQTATLHYDVRAPRRTFKKDLCEEKYPEVFKEVYTGDPTKTFRIEINDSEKTGGAAG